MWNENFEDFFDPSHAKEPNDWQDPAAGDENSVFSKEGSLLLPSELADALPQGILKSATPRSLDPTQAEIIVLEAGTSMCVRLHHHLGA